MIFPSLDRVKAIAPGYDIVGFYPKYWLSVTASSRAPLQGQIKSGPI